VKWTEVTLECIKRTNPTECMVTSGCVLFCTETFVPLCSKPQADTNNSWPTQM
jgi:hypothetical protein